MDEFFFQKRALEDGLRRAALALFDLTPAAGYRIEIPHTDPPVYIMVGDAATILGLLEDVDPED